MHGHDLFRGSRAHRCGPEVHQTSPSNANSETGFTDIEDPSTVACRVRVGRATPQEKNRKHGGFCDGTAVGHVGIRQRQNVTSCRIHGHWSPVSHPEEDGRPSTVNHSVAPVKSALFFKLYKVEPLMLHLQHGGANPEILVGPYPMK